MIVKFRDIDYDLVHLNVGRITSIEQTEEKNSHVNIHVSGSACLVYRVSKKAATNILKVWEDETGKCINCGE